MTEAESLLAVMDVPMAKKRAGPKPKPADPKPTVVSIKGTDEWRVWLQEGAEFCRTDAAKLIDAALTDYLKAKGFPKPPPRRA